MGQCGFHCWEQHILVKETVNFKNEEGKKKKKRAGIPTGKDNISLVDFERWSET